MAENRRLILDTDIGNDIDDSFAIAVLLTLEHIDIKLISTCFQNTEYRAKIVAKMLQAAGRTDIPVAIGFNNGEEAEPSLQRYVKDFSWDTYDGTVHSNSVDAMIDCIRNSDEKVTILAIGAATNLSMLLEKYPEVIHKSEIIGMYGSIRKGYKESNESCAEANVYVDLDSFRKIMESGWPMTLVPLDACREFYLDGENYQRIKHSESVICKEVMEQYHIWQEDYHGGAQKYDIETSTSILFDIPPVLYLENPEWFQTEELKITVTKDCRTVEDESGNSCKALLDIRQNGELEDFVTDRYLNFERYQLQKQ